MKLNGKQIRFVDYILDGFNMTDSAIKAGYSAKTAYSAGSRLYKNPKIQQAIQHRTKELTVNAFMSKDLYTKEIYKRYVAEKAPNVKKGYLEILGELLGYTGSTGKVTPTLAIFQALELKKEAIEKLGVSELPKDIANKIDANTINLDDLPEKCKEIVDKRLSKPNNLPYKLSNLGLIKPRGSRVNDDE